MSLRLRKLVAVTALRDTRGSVSGFVLAVSDVTDRRAVEAALRELDASPEPLRSTLADIEGWARSLREVVEAERQS